MIYFKKLYMILTLRCREASFLLTCSEEIELSKSEKIALRMHLFICHHCRMFKKHLSFLDKIFHKLSGIDFYKSDHYGYLSEEKKEQIKKKISEL